MGFKGQKSSKTCKNCFRMKIWVVLVILKKLSFGWFLKDLKDFVCFFSFFFYVFYFMFFFYFVFAENYIRIESRRGASRSALQGALSWTHHVSQKFRNNAQMVENVSFKDSNVGRFQFLNIFHNHDFEKSLSNAVDAFKVWASRGIPAGWKFSTCVFWPKKAVKHLKMVLGWKYGVCWAF